MATLHHHEVLQAFLHMSSSPADHQQQGIPFSMSGFSFERKASVTAITVSSWIFFHGSRPFLVLSMEPLDVDQS